VKTAITAKMVMGKKMAASTIALPRLPQSARFRLQEFAGRKIRENIVYEFLYLRTEDEPDHDRNGDKDRDLDQFHPGLIRAQNACNNFPFFHFLFLLFGLKMQ
jgi:hypothetical protein